MDHDDLPLLTWRELWEQHLQHNEADRELAERLGIDWASLTLRPEENIRPPTDAAILPACLDLDNGCQVRVNDFRQYDPNAHRLCGGRMHPLLRIRKLFEELQAQSGLFIRDCAVVFEPEYLIQFMAVLVLRKDYRCWGIMGLLPPVTCVLELQGEALDPEETWSTVFVIWFQSHYGISAATLERIRAIEWQRHAHNWTP